MTGQPMELRPYSLDDHERTYAWLQEPELRRLIGTRSAPTADSHRSWYEKARSREDVELYAAFSLEDLLGRIHCEGTNIQGIPKGSIFVNIKSGGPIEGKS